MVFGVGGEILAHAYARICNSDQVQGKNARIQTALGHIIKTFWTDEYIFRNKKEEKKLFFF